MRLAIFGGSGRAGRVVVEHALRHGHGVNALTRDPARISPHPELRVVGGDVRDLAAVASTLNGADAIVSTLGRQRRGPAVCTEGIRTVLSAAASNGPRRLIILTNYGVADSRDRTAYVAASWLLERAALRDEEQMEALVRDSDTTDEDARTAVAGLITFDTPYLGSPFGHTDVARWYQSFKQAFGGMLVPPAGSDAQLCLGTRKESGGGFPQGCDAAIPPYLPNTARVTAIAGDITVTRSFGPFHMYDIPLSSDGVVTVGSQHGYLAMNRKAQWPKAIKVAFREADCSITNDSVMRTAQAAARGGPGGAVSGLLSALIELKVDENALDGVLENRLTPGLVAYLAAANATAGCSHTKVFGHDGALDHAEAALKGYLDWLEPGTEVLSLRPVTADGRVASGWNEVNDTRTGDIDCSLNSASPAAEKGDIYYCSPSAATADACWVGEGRNSMLCLSDPMKRQVVRIWWEGTTGFGPTGPAEHSGTPLPIRLDLDNGAKCRLRNGGSWSIQEQHLDLVGFYRCDNGEAVWGGRRSTGINQKGKTWTVRVGGESGELATRKVRTAYYVALEK